MIDLRSHTPKGRRAHDTIVAAAEALFVTRGFHGTSVRDVAAAAGLPLATVVYHFARKEQLYATVLEAIGQELLHSLDQLPPSLAEPRAAARARIILRVEEFVRAVVRWTRDQPGRVRLLLRELLDNPPRLARAGRLPLAPFLERSAELIADAQRARVLASQPAELAVLHFVGALSYLVAATPTVDRIVGRARARELVASYETEALALARRILAFESANPPARRSNRPRTS
jgi:AcrR family transcriptional regulator